MFGNENQKKRLSLKALALLGVLLLAACSRPEPAAATEPESRTLSMGTAGEGEAMYLAGAAVASVINNTVPNTHVSIEASKGSPVNARNVSEGNLDLAMISGDAVYDAFYGTGTSEGEKRENLRILGACYPVLSSWAAGADTGMTMVHDVKGKTIASGTKASATEVASRRALAVMGIDETNTVWEPYGISEGVSGLRDGWADAAHSFSVVPVIAQRDLALERELVFLGYTEEELAELLADYPFYYRAVMPAGTYPGQETEVLTFGMKVFLCASEELDEELAYEIAMALDVNGAVYTGGYDFMAPMQEKEFLGNDCPIPLHAGAKRYYEEKGYLNDEEG